MLTRDQILGAADLKFDTVPVPEWGGEVRIQSMTGADRDAYEQSLVASRSADTGMNMRNVRARMVAFCAVDESGARLFVEADIDALGGKSAAALDRVFDRATKLNGLGAAEVAELGKPSAPTDSGASTSS